MHRIVTSKRRRLATPLAVVAACAATVGSAQAVHWPNFGGDAGRSGYQPVDEGGVPVRFLYNTDDSGTVRTSIITSAGGGPDVQKLAYGTDDGFLHLRTLATGAVPAGTPAQGADIDDGGDDSDVFGSGAQGSVTPVDTSTMTALGNVLALHNDDDQDGSNDISIAVIPEGGNTAGVEIKELAVADDNPGSEADVNTNAFTVNSSPVISAPDPTTGERSLYFIADRPINPSLEPTASRRLFKVDLANPGTSDVQITDVRFVEVSGAVTTASPTLLNVPSGDGTEPQVAVSFSTGNSVRTFSADDALAPRRQSGDLGNAAQTPSVPVRGREMAGQLPNPAPALYLAVRQNNDDGSEDDTTIAYELTPSTTDTVLLETTDSSTELAGFPAPAVATSRESEETTGHVVVTTAENLFSLNAADLKDGARLAFNDGLQAGTTGFSRTTAVISGDFSFVSRDNGRQLVLRTSTANPVSDASFTEDPRNAGDPATAGTTASFGQPSISRRFVQFGSDLGVTVYRAEAITFSVGDVEIVEGDSGTRGATVTIRLSQAASDPAAVTIATRDGTATVADDDYEALAPTTVNFAAGQTEQTVEVTLNGDTKGEPDEGLDVTLSDATGGPAIADGTGRVTIVDDDGTSSPPPGPPAASIADVAIGEGDQGPRTATLTVSLDRPATASGSVDFATANGTALSPGDYSATAGRVGFASGEQSKQLTVPVIGDLTDEQDETFAVRLSRATGGLRLADAEGIVTIVDDDKPAVVVDPEPVDARGISARVSPGRDRSAPFRFRTTGRLALPSGVPMSEGCTGRVSVQVKALNKTISTRRASLTSGCTYASRVTFKNRKRFTRSGRLKFTVRFLGNDRINAIRAKAVNVRTR